MMEAASVSEMLVHFYKTAWHYIPEYNTLIVISFVLNEVYPNSCPQEFAYLN
jgi:hypothetical protein